MKNYLLLSLFFLLSLHSGLCANEEDGSGTAAPLLDLIFAEGGVATDAASGMAVRSGKSLPVTYFNSTLQRWVAKFPGETDCFYSVDYTEAIKAALEGSFAFEIYYKANDINGTAPFSSQQYGGAGIEHIGGKVGFYAHIGGDYRELVARERLEAGTFVHVICTYDKVAGQLRLYINGCKEDTETATGEMQLPPEKSHWIGIGGDTSDNPDRVQSPLNGEIALARLYGTAITDAQAAALFGQIELKETVRPEADLVDIVFNTDGNAVNRANGLLTVTAGNELPAIYHDPQFGMEAARFDGSVQRYYKIDYSRNEAFKETLREGFTMETMYTTDAAGEQCPFSSLQYGGFGIDMEGRSLGFWIHLGGDYVVARAATPIEAGKVYHVVATYSRAQEEICLYVNGKFEGQAKARGELGFPPEAVSQWIGIGCDASAGSDYAQYPLRGTLYLARMYGKALTAEEASLLYDFEDRSVALAPGTYRLTNPLTGSALQDGLLIGTDHRQNTLSCAPEAIELSQMWEVEPAENGTCLRNMATGRRLRSVRSASIGAEGSPVRFYAYPNGTYAIDCDGLLHTDGQTVTDLGGDEASGSAWKAEPVEEDVLAEAAAETNRRLSAWYRPGTRYDEYRPNERLEALLAEPAGVEQCRALAEAIHVPAVRKLKVLQFNTWNNGRMITGGAEAIIRTIEATDPDILLLQEVRSQDFVDKVIDHFRTKGITWHGRSMNISTAILSKFPFDSIRSSDELGAGSYAYAKAVVKVENKTLALYSVHLDWKHLGYYFPRGFDGDSDTRPYAKTDPYTDAEAVLAENRKSRRPEEVRAMIEDMQDEMLRQRMIIAAGDFNEPSYLDWQADTRHLRDHNGLVIDWDCSLMLARAGMSDAYRQLYPDPVAFPGFTCNAGNRWVDKSEMYWAYGVDDRERIDQTYFYPHADMKLTHATIVGPVEDFYDNEVRLEPTADPIFTPEGPWASDHKAVLTEYEITVDVPMTCNDTRLADGAYYMAAVPEEGAEPVYTATNAQGRLDFCSAGQMPQKWLADNGALRTDGSGSVWLDRLGLLRENEDNGLAFALRTGMTDSVALSFGRNADFRADYLAIADGITPLRAQTPREAGEPAVFAFSFRRAASDIADGSIRHTSVVFAGNEAAACKHLSAQRMEWINRFEADKWQAVYFPAPVTRVRSLKQAADLRSGNGYLLARYLPDRKTLEPVDIAESEAIPAGAYLMRTTDDGLVQLIFDETDFTPQEAADGTLTGTGKACDSSASGYTLNEAGNRFVLQTETVVHPFQSYVVCGNPAEAEAEIPLPEITALQNTTTDCIEVAVRNRRIVVRGTDQYIVYDTAGAETDRHAALTPGVYLVRLAVTGQTRKVVVR